MNHKYADSGEQMWLENYSDGNAECHSCGAIGKPRRLIHLGHLCQHFVALCPICFTKLANLLAVQFLKSRRVTT